MRCLGLERIKGPAPYPGLLKKLIKNRRVHPSEKWFILTGKAVQNDRAVGLNVSVYTARPRLTVILPATSHCRSYLVVTTRGTEMVVPNLHPHVHVP